jgi:hypothetical protein
MAQNETQAKTCTVHKDVLMDTLSILTENEITFSIEGIDKSRETAILRITINPQSRRHKEAMDDMDSVVEDYNHYRYKSNNSTPMFTPWNERNSYDPRLTRKS